MFRAAIITDKGIKSKNLETKKMAEEWILDCAVKDGFKKARIRNIETGEEFNIEL